MKKRWFVGLTAAVLVSAAALTVSADNDNGITLIGTALIPGNALDLSGLAGNICQVDNNSICIPKATLGGFGSALTYTGHDGVFLAVPDRGPFDGRTDVPYLDRFHFLHMTVDQTAVFPPVTRSSNIITTFLDTRFLKAEDHKNFVGDAYAFLDGLRFDPEGVVPSRDGNFFVSDEYGPFINEFNRQGHLVRRIPVPSKFLLVDEPCNAPAVVPPNCGTKTGDVDTDGNSRELYPANNTFGRQANRGMEGLAITPDGRTLVGIMQNALLQDNGLRLNPDTGFPQRRGFNNRILTYNLETGDTHEYVYPMDAVNDGKGVNEILAINNHEFLVLERDNRTFFPVSGDPDDVDEPNIKRLYRIDLNKPGLTDVSNIPSLPRQVSELASAFEPDIIPVTKTLFLDLLNPKYVVATNAPGGPVTTIKDVVAEKIEGLAWGPNLPDGRQLLYVISDNDLTPASPTQIYAFAIGPEAGSTYEPQVLPEPLFPPGQVKKALR